MSFINQIENRNLLSPNGFKFTLTKYPKASFYSNKVSIPGLSLGVAIQPNPFRDLPVPGDKIEYSDFTFDFLVDESMENYITLYNWIVSLGYPENIDQFNDLRRNQRYFPSQDSKDIFNLFSDGSLEILNSNLKPIYRVKFKDLFPVSLTPLEFDATRTDYNYFTVNVVFKYTIFQLQTLDGIVV